MSIITSKNNTFKIIHQNDNELNGATTFKIEWKNKSGWFELDDIWEKYVHASKFLKECRISDIRTFPKSFGDLMELLEVLHRGHLFNSIFRNK